MQDRRDFLQQTGAFALGFDQDVEGNLERIAQIGFRELKSAFSVKSGYYGLKTKEFKAMAKDTGLGAPNLALFLSDCFPAALTI